MSDDRNDGGHVVERLDAWRTGEIEGARAAEVEAHLEACASCREALADLEAFAAAVEAGYRASEAAAEEPDWGASRAAIVARTSGRPARSGWPLLQWMPQVAIALVAVIAIGVLLEEGVRGPDDVGRELSAPGAGPAGDAALSTAPSSEVEELGVPLPPAPSEDAAPARGPVAVEPRNEDVAADDREQAAAPAPAAEPEVVRGEAAGVADEARPEPAEEEAEANAPRRAEAEPRRNAELDRAAPELAQKTLPAPERFRADANAALAASDTTLARDALEFYADSVAPADLPDAERERLEDLAERLAELLAAVP